jgi:crotonobetainyl-CoA:carnitine CoA-transferase CaiB-like acyl-CoA transferase
MSETTQATNGLLSGVSVLVLGGDVAARAGRVLADLGADVVRLHRADAPDPIAGRRAAWLAWSAGTTVAPATDADAAECAATADIVIDTPHDPATIVLDPSCAPAAVWVRITPFGLVGPRARWHATDHGVMAASANMYSTGDPTRAPVHAAEPTSHAHAGGEAAYAAIAALASGRAQIVDLSMQECVFIANMGSVGRYAREQNRGSRGGAKIGKTREIWPTRDGFVSFGIRGGKARQASMEIVSKLVRDAGIEASALDQDWATWHQNTASDDDLAAMERAIGEYFASQTMQALYDIACDTNLMLAPANSPRETYQSLQLESRGFFGPVGEVARFPVSFVKVHGAAPAVPSGPARVLDRVPALPRRAPSHAAGRPDGGVWAGTFILEFGSGAAGPIATRYFVEHGATVLRVESPSRPDFLRAMAVGAPGNPHGLEGAGLYDSLNCGKRNVTLNLKHPDAVALVKRLVVERAHAVAENYAPRAMKGFGLDYDALAAVKPDLVMISACLNGQTGPHKDYPGFGGQGSALSGWNWLTGWPDLEPVGPFGTITDSLAPRYVAAALAAGLLHHRRTGRGCYLDLAQVEAGLYALSPWLLDYAIDGTIGMRRGNADPNAVVHGVYPCADEDGVGDRWVAIACWTDAERDALASVVGGVGDDAITAYTATRRRIDVADALQAVGVEAVPVEDFADTNDDPQVEARDHFIDHTHPYMGPGRYERNGIRYSDAPTGYDRAGPTLGQDNDWVLGDLLGLSTEEIERLRESGAMA